MNLPHVHAGGRPTKLTPELRNNIAQAVAAGNYIETAALLYGVHKDTLYEWLKRGAKETARLEREPESAPNPTEMPYVEFSDALKRALAESETVGVLHIRSAARESWQAAAWHLERKFPQRWGRKERHVEQGNMAVDEWTGEERVVAERGSGGNVTNILNVFAGEFRPEDIAGIAESLARFFGGTHTTADARPPALPASGEDDELERLLALAERGEVGTPADHGRPVPPAA